MGHTYRGGKSGGELLTLFDSYSYDGVRDLVVLERMEKLVVRENCFLTVCLWVDKGQVAILVDQLRLRSCLLYLEVKLRLKRLRMV